MDSAAFWSWRIGSTIRLAARYPRATSRHTATKPKMIIQVKRWWMGANNSLEDCQTKVFQLPSSREPPVDRLVSGSGAKPMIEVDCPPWPSLGAGTQPG